MHYERNDSNRVIVVGGLELLYHRFELKCADGDMNRMIISDLYGGENIIDDVWNDVAYDPTDRLSQVGERIRSLSDLMYAVRLADSLNIDNMIHYGLIDEFIMT